MYVENEKKEHSWIVLCVPFGSKKNKVLRGTFYMAFLIQSNNYKIPSREINLFVSGLVFHLFSFRWLDLCYHCGVFSLLRTACLYSSCFSCSSSKRTVGFSLSTIKAYFTGKVVFVSWAGINRWQRISFFFYSVVDDIDDDGAIVTVQNYIQRGGTHKIHCNHVMDNHQQNRRFTPIQQKYQFGIVSSL
jgi:hypothetical protein